MKPYIIPTIEVSTIYTDYMCIDTTSPVESGIINGVVHGGGEPYSPTGAM